MASRALAAASLALVGALWVVRPWRRRRASQEVNEAALSGRPTRRERRRQSPPAEGAELSNQDMIQVDLDLHRILVEQKAFLEVVGAPRRALRKVKADLKDVRADLIQRVQHLQPEDPGASSWVHYRRGGDSERRSPKSSDYGLSWAMVKDVGPWGVRVIARPEGVGRAWDFFGTRLNLEGTLELGHAKRGWIEALSKQGLRN